ncbi:MAG: hypothetical protein AAGF85_04930 [Bacteroidota bacterium]
MRKVLHILLIIILSVKAGVSQDLLQTEIVNLVGGGDVNVTGPTLGASFNPSGFTNDETVTLFLDVSLVNPRDDDRNLAGTTEDLFVFIFEGGGTIQTDGDPVPAAQLTRVEGDIYSIDFDLASGELLSSDIIADGGFARLLIKATTFEAGQSGDFEIRFTEVPESPDAVFTVPESFTADETVSIFLNSDLAFGDDRVTTGELTGEADVFMWSGANNFSIQPEGQTDFNAAFEPGRLDVLSSNIFRITLQAREYYGAEDDVVISNIALLFKNTDGSLSARPANGDFSIAVAQPPSVEVPDQAVRVFPASFTADDLVTVIFDSKVADEDGNTALLASDEIYLFSGVSISDGGDGFERTPEGQIFDAPVGPGLMRALGDRVYSISFIPRSYFGLADEEEIFDLTMLFRNSNGSRQTTPNFMLEADECPQ